jgi:hypothetical protein
MTRQNVAKINQLLKTWPSKAICISDWLEKKGIDRKLASYYQKSGWLEKVGNGAYKKAGEVVEWPSGLAALQNQAKLKIHLGGKSALHQQGYVHYIPMGENYPLYLFSQRNVKLPAWFKNYNWKVKIAYTQTNLFGSDSDEALRVVEINGVSVKISSAERAIMEAIHLIRNRWDYDEILKLMGMLSAIRPKVVQSLLEKCNSIKVKRAFMVMAEKHNYPWLKKVDLSKIHFGKGKRQFIKDGYLEPKYQITIPKEYEDIEIEI